jgi:uncharacterized damage-inducible protein DinB
MTTIRLLTWLSKWNEEVWTFQTPDICSNQLDCEAGMTRPTEIETFRRVLDAEAEKALQVIRSIPPDQYDFKVDPKGRSIGQLAWHMSEIEGCISFDVKGGCDFSYEHEVPNMKRPTEVEGLAHGYRRVHDEAMSRLAGVTSDELDREVTFADGRPMTLRQVLWDEIVHHLIHHRGQLVLMCRQAGGHPPGLYGPNREEMQAMMARMQAATP